MEKTLVYNFNHFYGSGMNTFLVTMPNFEYKCTLSDEDLTLSEEELKDKYWKIAFELAVRKFIDDNPWTLKDPYDF